MKTALIFLALVWGFCFVVAMGWMILGIIRDKKYQNNGK